jgi:hypothetical protein
MQESVTSTDRDHPNLPGINYSRCAENCVIRRRFLLAGSCRHHPWTERHASVYRRAMLELNFD